MTYVYVMLCDVVTLPFWFIKASQIIGYEEDEARF